jgi:hypothetical protein
VKKIFARNTTDTSRALGATTDTSGRQVPAEPYPSTYVKDTDTRNAERGRGCLSGDGQYHGAHRRQ